MLQVNRDTRLLAGKVGVFWSSQRILLRGSAATEVLEAITQPRSRSRIEGLE
jgi:hypothetical protein